MLHHSADCFFIQSLAHRREWHTIVQPERSDTGWLAVPLEWGIEPAPKQAPDEAGRHAGCTTQSEAPVVSGCSPLGGTGPAEASLVEESSQRGKEGPVGTGSTPFEVVVEVLPRGAALARSSPGGALRFRRCPIDFCGLPETPSSVVSSRLIVGFGRIMEAGLV